MDDSDQIPEARKLFRLLGTKLLLVLWLFFIYVAVLWFWDYQSLIEKITGSAALFLSFIILFIPFEDKKFKQLMVLIIGFSSIFFLLNRL